MNSEPKVSFIMPVFDEADYLIQGFESVLSQSYKNYEVLVSDNASSDHTWEIIEQYQKKYPGIFKGHRFTQGVHPMMNMNKCLEMSSGDLCYHFGGDDYLKTPDFLQNAVAPFIQNPNLGGHFTRLEYFDSSNNKTLAMNPPEEAKNWISGSLMDFVKIYTQNAMRDDMFIGFFPRENFTRIMHDTYRFSAESAGWWTVLQLVVEGKSQGKKYIFDSEKKSILMKRVNKDPQAKVKSKAGASANIFDPPGFRLWASIKYSFQTAALVQDPQERKQVLNWLLWKPRRKSAEFPQYMGPAVAFLLGGYFWGRLYMRSRDLSISQVIRKKLRLRV